MSKRIGIYLLFFASGICGLIYQVIWVRQFGNVFGNTVYSAALVTAVFMSGLGLGSYLAGRLADLRYGNDPEWSLKAYGFLEIGIGIMGLIIALILPNLGLVSGLVSTYGQGSDGWHTLTLASRVFRYGLAVLILLPVTTCMGGTLSLLVRYLVRRDLTVAGLRVGTLYGINTAGAALGAFGVDFALIPGVGLLASQSLAAMLNLVVGLVAIRWASRTPREAGVTQSPIAPIGSTRAARLPVAFTGSAILLSGFAAMGMEILWFRMLVSVLGSLRATFSLLLTVILVGIWLGSWAGGVVHRRFGRPALLYILSQAAFAVTTLGFFLFFEPADLPKSELIGLMVNSSGWARRLVEVWAQLRLIVVLVGLPALLMGFAYPLANANIQRVEASVGTRAGLLYLMNTAGAVAGAMVTGFVLLPDLGMQTSVLILASCSVLPIVPLYLSLSVPGSRRGWAGTAAAGACLAFSVSAIVFWALLPSGYLDQKMFFNLQSMGRIIASSEGINESIVVTEKEGTGERRLNTNGHSMSATTYGAQRYMRAFVHIPLLQMESPERVLVICFGVGNTLHSASLHRSVRRLDVVDLSRHVLEHAGWFSRWNHDVLLDPRVSVYVNDGRQHLRMQPEGTYDLITLEPPPLTHAGVSSLYTTEFYDLVRSRLKPGGQVSQWLPAHQVTGPVLASMVRSFIDVFPGSILLSGFENEFILLGSRDRPLAIDPEALVRRLRGQPEVRADLERIDLGTPTEIIGTYAGSNASMARVSRNTQPVTDDWPIMEYSMISYFETIIPEELFAVETVDGWCPRCFADGTPVPAVEGLTRYLSFLGAFYRSLDFRAFLPVRDAASTGWVIDGDPASVEETFRSSGYLQRIMGRATPR